MLHGISDKDKCEIFACYAEYLLMGKNLKYMRIKSSTAQRYLVAAAKLFPVDPRRDEFGNIHPIFSQIWTEAKRWEQMPNRREPLTKTMIHKLLDLSKHSPDSRYEAITDWLVVGLSAGLRISEYGQPTSKLYEHNLDKFEKAINGAAKGFLLKDIVFRGKNDKYINNSKHKKLDIECIDTVTLRWRFQKNNQNGQKIKFGRNDKDTSLCPVRALLRIRQRAQTLNISDDTPVAVFSYNNKTSFVTSGLVNKIIKHAAKLQYGENLPDEELKKFTPHSVRVGAAVLLDEAGESGVFIKKRLRWRSDTFMDYLRNTFIAAKQHIQAMFSTS